MGEAGVLHDAGDVRKVEVYEAGVLNEVRDTHDGLTSSEAQLRRYLKLDAEEKAVIALKDFKGIIKI